MPSPFYGTTPRYALRKLLGTSNGSDIDAGFDALATDVDNNFTGYKSGTHAARLAATALDGLLWRETDTGLLYLGIGSATWTPVMMPGAWQALTLGTNIIAATGHYVPSARQEGDRVVLKGAMQNNTGGAFAGTWATIPAALVPSSGAAGVAGNVTGNVGVPITISAAGVLTLASSSLSNGVIVGLDGVSYTLS